MELLAIVIAYLLLSYELEEIKALLKPKEEEKKEDEAG